MIALYTHPAATSSAWPFELAGVTVRNPDGQPSKDWLETQGYAQAA